MKLLEDSANSTKSKIEILTKAKSSLNDQFKKGSISADTYNDQILEVERQLKKANNQLEVEEAQLKKVNRELEQAESGSKKFGKATKDVGEDAEKSSNKFGNFASKVSSSISSIIKWGTAVGVAASGSITTLAVNTASTGDRIDKLSQKMGLSRESFQQWDYVLSQSGASIDGMQSGFKTLNVRINEALTGGKTGTEIFKKLGITINNSTPKDEVFQKVVSSLQKMEDGVIKAQLAQDLFGKSGQDLMPLLNSESGSVDELVSNFKKLGITMSDEAIDASVKFTDTVDTLKRQIGGLVNNISSKVLPTLSEYAEKTIGFVDNIFKEIDASDKSTKAISKIIGENLTDIILKVATKLPDFLELGIEIIANIILGVSNSADRLGTLLGFTIVNLVGAVIDMAPMFIKSGLILIQNLIMGITAESGFLIENVLNLLFDLIDILLDNLPGFLDIGVDIVLTLIDGISEAIPTLVSKIPELITKIVDTLINLLPKLIETGVDLALGLLDGLFKALPEIIGKLPEIIGAIIGGIYRIITETNWWDIAWSIAKGLWEALKNAFKSLIGSVGNFFSSLFGFGNKDNSNIENTGRIRARSYIKGFQNEWNRFSLNLPNISGGVFNPRLAGVHTKNNNIVINMNNNFSKGLNYEQQKNIIRKIDKELGRYFR